jgi:YD repeat-containing protein
LALTAGTHNIQATAWHPNPNGSPQTDPKTHNFTVNTGGPTILQNWQYTYDPDGRVAARTAGSLTQNLVWDAFGRLVEVNQRDASQNGFDWFATYDALGRRLRARYLPVRANVPACSAARQTDSWFDPEIAAGMDFRGPHGSESRVLTRPFFTALTHGLCMIFFRNLRLLFASPIHS